MGAERGRPVRGGLERDPGLGGERVRLGALRGVGAGGEVVAGERPGQLRLAEGLEPAGGGEVAGLAVLLGQGVVGDLADERLHERVLPALR